MTDSAAVPRRPRRALLLNAALAAVLLAGGVTAVLLLTGSSGDPATAGGTVRSATAQVGDVTATVAASGQVSPVRTVDANFKTSGTIATVDVAVGQTVTAGQQLGTLDTADAQRALTLAEDQLTTAQDQLTAAEQASTASTTTSSSGGSGSGAGGNSGGGSGSSQGSAASVSAAKASVVQAQGAVDDARAALDATTLTAPIGGLVTAVNGNVGDQAGSSGGSSSASSSHTSASGAGAGSSTAGTGSSTSGSAFVEIADTSAYVVSASFAEADVAKLAVGQTATVAFPAVSGATGSGTVSSIAPTGTTSSNVVTFPVTITLSALPDGVRLGQTAQISVVTASATNVLEVPSAAVRGAGSNHTVTVLGTNNTRTPTTVQVGVVGDTTTQITSGLKEGDRVLISVDTTVSTSTNQQTGRGGFGGGAGGLGGGGFGGGRGTTGTRGNG